MVGGKGGQEKDTERVCPCSGGRENLTGVARPSVLSPGRQVMSISRAEIPVLEVEILHGFASCLKGQCETPKPKWFPSLLADM